MIEQTGTNQAGTNGGHPVGNGGNSVDGGTSADLAELAALRSLSARLAALQSPLVSRGEFASMFGLPFDGKRDLNKVLGYSPYLTPADYRLRYERGGIAKRIVECFPLATWGNRFAVVENPNPNTSTRFERQTLALYDRLNVWEMFLRADILCQLGRYSIIYLDVADGNPESELPRASSPDDLWHLTPLGEEDATVDVWNENVKSRRYGQPEFYKLSLGLNINKVESRRVHWSRIIHIAEGCLTNDLFGVPILRAVWNYLDDLDKVRGGGAEAAWLQMSPGITAKIDPEVARKLPNFVSKMAEMEQEIENYEHGQTRFMKLTGVDVQRLQATAPVFSANAHTIMQLIAGTISYPFRVLFGSEMGELASSQDRSNANDRIAERYMRFGDAVVRNFNQRLFDYGYLTPPASRNGYEIVWPVEEELSEDEKAGVAEKFARANAAQRSAGGQPVLTADEIRDLVLGLEPLEEQQIESVEEDSNSEDGVETLRGARRAVTHARSRRDKVALRMNSRQMLTEAKLKLQEPGA